MEDSPNAPAYPGHYYLEDLQSLRASALHSLTLISVIIGVLWYLYLTVVLESTNVALWLGPIVLVGGSYLSYSRRSRWNYSTAASVYIAALFVVVFLTAWGNMQPLLLLLLTFPVGVIGVLTAPYAGFAAAGVTTAAVAGLSIFPFPYPVSSSIVYLTGTLTTLVAILIWIATYPLRTTVQWAWTSYDEARQQADALREHRAELSRRVKDLDAAYDRLEAMAAELERARQAAIEARRLKAEFAANISHELRTPLNLIIGFSEMMALAPQAYDIPLPGVYRGDVQAIYHNARHLSQLINDVLDLSQIEAGRMGLIREPVALGKVIDEAVEAAGHLVDSKGLSLTLDIPPDLPVVEADPTRIRQVLINLLNNSARFTDQGGVTITVKVGEHDVIVAVADTGSGIAQEDIPRIFEEFRQLDGSIRRRVGGSGLGLPISKRFVELHGGRIWVESELGQGTTVFFSLPLREQWALSQLPAAYETWARFVPAKGADKTIAVVDSDTRTIQFLEPYLNGYTLLQVADLEEACQLVKQRPVGAIMVAASSDKDYLTAGLSAVRARFRDIPVAICSVHDGRLTNQFTQIVSHLIKPITQQQFLTALADLDDSVHSLLIVDDDPEVVRLLSRIVHLAPRRYRVLVANGGARALEILRTRHPDAVVLDLTMPEIDGYMVLAQMQADESLRNVPVIIVTGTSGEETVRADLFGLTRRDGLSMEELARCMSVSLDALRSPTQTGSVPTPPAASVVSRALSDSH